MSIRGDGLKVVYKPTIDKANKIAEECIKMCMGHNPCGCRGTTPNPPGEYYQGVWIQDALWTYCDALFYWTDVSEGELRDYLYSEAANRRGVISFFTEAQEKTGEYKGNIPTSRWDDRYPNPGINYFRSKWDLGGYYDLARRPRTNHRDIVQEGAFLIHATYRHWKLFNDVAYVPKYYRAFHDYMEFRKKGIDKATGLYRSVYGLADVAIDYAVPRSSTLLRENAACVQMFKKFSEMARPMAQYKKDAEEYQAIADGIRKGINAYLWDDEKGYYLIKLFCNPTTNKKSPAYGITQDSHFRVNGNMVLLYHGIPDSQEKIKSLISAIERTEGRLKIYGREVVPSYPNGWINELFNDGHYFFNSMYANWYATALFKLGYPDKTINVLSKQAEAVVRDRAFLSAMTVGEVPEERILTPFLLLRTKGHW